MPKALSMDRCEGDATKEVHYYQWTFKQRFPFIGKQLVWSYLCTPCYGREEQKTHFMGVASVDDNDRCDVRWLVKGGSDG